ncbi:LuxR C-terminal-related transcriptional regulator [Amycolatopsis sp., V23-08]|uniref:LuxR C-terminal-related transcriptional regulator n=1 Tax=Amycolatopsis heterodermiae TaxID=3110235 RepID=A0ABU5RLW2_9PSEU|nr:LuxR C-terminal-related transcriptional regulator [Amycolatopsis sp., V23-08]MEA5367282.1 LuxR C-terminal-related transcriptional regulator [Amycolatopsis sp., V23-08]
MAGIRTISPIGPRTLDAARDARTGIIGDFVESADMPLAALGAGLRLGGGNAAFFRWLGRRPAEVLGESFPELVATGPDYLRERLNRVAEGREQRFRGSVSGLVPAGADRVTIVAGRMRAPGAAILLTVLPETAPAGLAGARAELAGSVTGIEAKILQGIASGMSSLEMADKFYLSRQGIDYHVARLQRKFKSRNRVELISRAFASGLLDSTAWPPRVPECRRAS